MFGRNSLLGLCALGLSTSLAFADDHANSGSTWFALVDFSTNLSTDAMPVDSDTTNTYSGGLTEDLDTSFGIGVGYRYNNNIGAILRYEEADLEVGSQVITGGTSQAVTSSSDTEISNIMLEAAYFIPYSENLEFFVLGGIGKAEIETNRIDLAGAQASCGAENKETTMRVGIGATYYMSQTNGFYAGVTRTDYGDVRIRDFDSGCDASESTAYDKDLESDDFRIGYFMSF